MSFHRLSGLVVLVAGLVYFFCIHRAVQEVIIQTKFGGLKGFKALSRDGRAYNVFRAIPYAKPPVGQLRFQPPVENDKWEGLKDAISLPPLCVQADPVWQKSLGQEDCLYLNVFTPKLPKKGENRNLLPVMVFIHGGYFMFGGTDLYDPVYFMDEDVVVVTIHYRLGAFGFLSTADEVVTGNMGLKDQVMALEWVKATIQDFGGDPNLVTIFGESAGGASVHLHMFSPLSTGLFQRAISQSGSSLCEMANQKKDRKAQAVKLGNALSCPTQSSEALMNCLKTKDPMDIVETHKFYNDMLFHADDIYGPTLEKGGDAFLSTDIREMYKAGNVAKIPWLAGVNSHEGGWRAIPILQNKEISDKLYNNWSTIAPIVFAYPEDSETSAKVLKYYFGDSPKPFSWDDFQSLTKLFSDRSFFTGVGEAARFHVKYAPTYLYYFTRSSPVGLGLIAASAKGTFPPILNYAAAALKMFLYTKVFDWEVPNYGACHADELKYQFHTFPLTGIRKGNPDYEFSKSFVKMWVSFARTGHPGKYNGVEWREAEPDKSPRYMHIGEAVGQMIDEPFTASLKFWESIRLNNM